MYEYAMVLVRSSISEIYLDQIILGVILFVASFPVTVGLDEVGFSLLWLTERVVTQHLHVNYRFYVRGILCHGKQIGI